MINDKKAESLNLPTLMTNRLHTLENRLTSLLNIVAATGTDLALPSTSHGPELPARRDSIPMVELNVTQQMVQETVKDLDTTSSKVRHYKKYLQNCTNDIDKKATK